ncbi:MAG: 50S ribosomal protein L30 [Alphaproteobacteria bacterium]|jgi:large subunit ribosomal protein L30|nr:50S ribosomal protein L30 [Alphaproteobacteria bacterium]
MADKMITVRQVKSVIGRNEKQRATVKGLGLRGINSTKQLKDTPEVRGMVKKVSHLVEIVE